MNAPQLNAPAIGLSADDIFYIIFRHKWKIIICTIIGVLGAAAVYRFQPPPFQSEATLFVRYVTENSAPGLPGNDKTAVSMDQGGQTIMNTEVEILRSMDLADQVADIITPDKILSSAKGPKDRGRAASMIQGNLIIQPVPQSSVIQLIYRSTDPTLVQPVLSAIVEAYLKKHLEIHQGSGAVGELISQESDQLGSRLSQTEDELRQAKDKAGIISLEDVKQAYSAQEARLQQEILSANADLAERSAMLEAIFKQSQPVQKASQPVAPTVPETAIPSAQLDAYRNLYARIDRLQKSEQQLLSQFTDQSTWVQEVRAQITDAGVQKQRLEAKYPGLTRLGAPVLMSQPTTTQGSSFDIAAESARLTGLEAKIKVLNTELEQVQAKAAKVSALEGSISTLQRQKDLYETNYRVISTHLAASQIDEQLSAGHALNIGTIQNPTPPGTDWSKTYKKMAMIGVGCLLFGLAWACLIEFYLDRTIRRPSDVERGLQIPLFLSVPNFRKKELEGATKQIFHETLRDRLIGYFESKNLTHKPKLVAVTGVGKNSGVTTTASGLAHSLSQTGDGNVLLVDMTAGQGSSQQFFKGKAVCGISELLDSRNAAKVDERLYVVGEEKNSDKLSRALPLRFSQLVPQLKASDFDYIIFDMPPVSQISITPRLAGFMDMVLLVLESEHTDRDITQQAVSLLANSRAHVGAVLNRTKNYLPSRAQHNFLGLT